MPAIDIARLKIQAATLVEKFDQPATFLKSLHEILDLYADRTMRVGLAAPATVLRAYRAPQSVLRQIEFELAPLAATFPEQTMQLTDALWQDATLETRQLAAILIGRINPQTPHIVERVSAWVSQTRDQQLRKTLLNTSLYRMRRETPDQFLALIQTWLDPLNPKMWPGGIQALIPLIRDAEFDNLPPVFDLARPVLEESPSHLQHDITELINALYQASPVETTYLLRRIVGSAMKPQAPITLRRAIPDLAAGLQAPLAEMLKQRTGK